MTVYKHQRQCTYHNPQFYPCPMHQLHRYQWPTPQPNHRHHCSNPAPSTSKKASFLLNSTSLSLFAWPPATICTSNLSLFKQNSSPTPPPPPPIPKYDPLNSIRNRLFLHTIPQLPPTSPVPRSVQLGRPTVVPLPAREDI